MRRLPKIPPGTLCHYCQVAPATTRDHIVPKALGGVGATWNLVPSCQKCNQIKSHDVPTCECEKCKLAVKRQLKVMLRKKEELDGRDEVLTDCREIAKQVKKENRARRKREKKGEDFYNSGDSSWVHPRYRAFYASLPEKDRRDP